MMALVKKERRRREESMDEAEDQGEEFKEVENEKWANGKTCNVQMGNGKMGNEEKM
jgi:hypothetical protein